MDKIATIPNRIHTDSKREAIAHVSQPFIRVARSQDQNLSLTEDNKESNIIHSQNILKQSSKAAVINQQLLKALELQQYSKAKTFLRSGANVDIKDIQNQNIFHIVSKQVDLQQSQKHIQNSNKIQIAYISSIDFLVYLEDKFSSYYKNFGLQSRLLNQVSKVGQTPLALAVITQQVQKCQLLIKMGASPNQIDRQSNTPLHLAVPTQNQELIDLILQYSFNLDYENLEGQTPFLLACKYKNLRLVKFLVSKENIEVTKQDNNGNNSLHLFLQMASGQDVKMFNFLLHKVDVHLINQTNDQGITPYDILMKCFNKVQNASMLFDTLNEFIQQKFQNNDNPIPPALETITQSIQETILDTEPNFVTGVFQQLKSNTSTSNDSNISSQLSKGKNSTGKNSLQISHRRKGSEIPQNSDLSFQGSFKSLENAYKEDKQSPTSSFQNIVYIDNVPNINEKTDANLDRHQEQVEGNNSKSRFMLDQLVNGDSNSDHEIQSVHQNNKHHSIDLDKRKSDNSPTITQQFRSLNLQPYQIPTTVHGQNLNISNHRSLKSAQDQPLPRITQSYQEIGRLSMQLPPSTKTRANYDERILDSQIQWQCQTIQSEPSQFYIEDFTTHQSDIFMNTQNMISPFKQKLSRQRSLPSPISSKNASSNYYQRLHVITDHTNFSNKLSDQRQPSVSPKSTIYYLPLMPEQKKYFSQLQQENNKQQKQKLFRSMQGGGQVQGKLDQAKNKLIDQIFHENSSAGDSQNNNRNIEVRYGNSEDVDVPKYNSLFSQDSPNNEFQFQQPKEQDANSNNTHATNNVNQYDQQQGSIINPELSFKLQNRSSNGDQIPADENNYLLRNQQNLNQAASKQFKVPLLTHYLDQNHSASPEYSKQEVQKQVGSKQQQSLVQGRSQDVSQGNRSQSKEIVGNRKHLPDEQWQDHLRALQVKQKNAPQGFRQRDQSKHISQLDKGAKKQIQESSNSQNNIKEDESFVQLNLQSSNKNGEEFNDQVRQQNIFPFIESKMQHMDSEYSIQHRQNDLENSKSLRRFHSIERILQELDQDQSFGNLSRLRSTTIAKRSTSDFVLQQSYLNQVSQLTSFDNLTDHYKQLVGHPKHNKQKNLLTGTHNGQESSNELQITQMGTTLSRSRSIGLPITQSSSILLTITDTGGNQLEASRQLAEVQEYSPSKFTNKQQMDYLKRQFSRRKSQINHQVQQMVQNNSRRSYDKSSNRQPLDQGQDFNQIEQNQQYEQDNATGNSAYLSKYQSPFGKSQWRYLAKPQQLVSKLAETNNQCMDSIKQMGKAKDGNIQCLEQFKPVNKMKDMLCIQPHESISSTSVSGDIEVERQPLYTQGVNSETRINTKSSNGQDLQDGHQGLNYGQQVSIQQEMNQDFRPLHVIGNRENSRNEEIQMHQKGIKQLQDSQDYQNNQVKFEDKQPYQQGESNQELEERPFTQHKNPQNDIQTKFSNQNDDLLNQNQHKHQDHLRQQNELLLSSIVNNSEDQRDKLLSGQSGEQVQGDKKFENLNTRDKQIKENTKRESIDKKFVENLQKKFYDSLVYSTANQEVFEAIDKKGAQNVENNNKISDTLNSIFVLNKSSMDDSQLNSPPKSYLPLLYSNSSKKDLLPLIKAGKSRRQIVSSQSYDPNLYTEYTNQNQDNLNVNSATKKDTLLNFTPSTNQTKRHQALFTTTSSMQLDRDEVTTQKDNRTFNNWDLGDTRRSEITKFGGSQTLPDQSMDRKAFKKMDHQINNQAINQIQGDQNQGQGDYDEVQENYGGDIRSGGPHKQAKAEKQSKKVGKLENSPSYNQKVDWHHYKNDQDNVTKQQRKTANSKLRDNRKSNAVKRGEYDNLSDSTGSLGHLRNQSSSIQTTYQTTFSLTQSAVQKLNKQMSSQIKKKEDVKEDFESNREFGESFKQDIAGVNSRETRVPILDLHSNKFKQTKILDSQSSSTESSQCDDSQQWATHILSRSQKSIPKIRSGSQNNNSRAGSIYNSMQRVHSNQSSSVFNSLQNAHSYNSNDISTESRVRRKSFKYNTRSNIESYPINNKDLMKSEFFSILDSSSSDEKIEQSQNYNQQSFKSLSQTGISNSNQENEDQSTNIQDNETEILGPKPQTNSLRTNSNIDQDQRNRSYTNSSQRYSKNQSSSNPYSKYQPKHQSQNQKQYDVEKYNQMQDVILKDFGERAASYKFEKNNNVKQKSPSKLKLRDLRMKDLLERSSIQSKATSRKSSGIHKQSFSQEYNKSTAAQLRRSLLGELQRSQDLRKFHTQEYRQSYDFTQSQEDSQSIQFSKQSDSNFNSSPVMTHTAYGNQSIKQQLNQHFENQHSDSNLHRGKDNKYFNILRQFDIDQANGFTNLNEFEDDPQLNGTKDKIIINSADKLYNKFINKLQNTTGLTQFNNDETQTILTSSNFSTFTKMRVFQNSENLERVSQNIDLNDIQKQYQRNHDNLLGNTQSTDFVSLQRKANTKLQNKGNKNSDSNIPNSGVKLGNANDANLKLQTIKDEIQSTDRKLRTPDQLSDQNKYTQRHLNRPKPLHDHQLSQKRFDDSVTSTTNSRTRNNINPNVKATDVSQNSNQDQFNSYSTRFLDNSLKIKRENQRADSDDVTSSARVSTMPRSSSAYQQNSNLKEIYPYSQANQKVLYSPLKKYRGHAPSIEYMGKNQRLNTELGDSILRLLKEPSGFIYNQEGDQILSQDTTQTKNLKESNLQKNPQNNQKREELIRSSSSVSCQNEAFAKSMSMENNVDTSVQEQNQGQGYNEAKKNALPIKSKPVQSIKEDIFRHSGRKQQDGSYVSPNISTDQSQSSGKHGAKVQSMDHMNVRVKNFEMQKLQYAKYKQQIGNYMDQQQQVESKDSLPNQRQSANYRSSKSADFKDSSSDQEAVRSLKFPKLDDSLAENFHKYSQQINKYMDLQKAQAQLQNAASYANKGLNQTFEKHFKGSLPNPQMLQQKASELFVQPNKQRAKGQSQPEQKRPNSELVHAQNDIYHNEQVNQSLPNLRNSKSQNAAYDNLSLAQKRFDTPTNKQRLSQNYNRADHPLNKENMVDQNQDNYVNQINEIQQLISGQSQQPNFKSMLLNYNKEQEQQENLRISNENLVKQSKIIPFPDKSNQLRSKLQNKNVQEPNSQSWTQQSHTFGKLANRLSPRLTFAKNFPCPKGDTESEASPSNSPHGSQQVNVRSQSSNQDSKPPNGLLVPRQISKKQLIKNKAKVLTCGTENQETQSIDEGVLDNQHLQDRDEQHSNWKLIPHSLSVKEVKNKVKALSNRSYRSHTLNQESNYFQPQYTQNSGRQSNGQNDVSLIFSVNQALKSGVKNLPCINNQDDNSSDSSSQKEQQQQEKGNQSHYYKANFLKNFFKSNSTPGKNQKRSSTQQDEGGKQKRSKGHESYPSLRQLQGMDIETLESISQLQLNVNDRKDELVSGLREVGTNSLNLAKHISRIPNEILAQSSANASERNNFAQILQLPSILEDDRETVKTPISDEKRQALISNDNKLRRNTIETVNELEAISLPDHKQKGNDAMDKISSQKIRSNNSFAQLQPDKKPNSFKSMFLDLKNRKNMTFLKAKSMKYYK